jgi:hypothetical protein
MAVIHRITTSINLETIDCGSCGLTFAVPDTWKSKRVEKGDWFHCPNGHEIRYGDSENSRLRRELEAEAQRRTRAEERARRATRDRERAERQAAAQKGQVTKLKKRAAGGVCPHCNRTFEQLAEHMQSKHPERVEEALYS